jgi:hypothetical protein
LYLVALALSLATGIPAERIASKEGDLMAKKTRISAFWGWFSDWHQDVATAYANGDAFWLDTNLTAQVKQIEPRLNWEMGPYYDPENTLVISPSVRDNIALTQRIVAAAPALPGWHFLPAKPPKKLQRLVMELPGMAEAKVCANDWVYRLTAYNRMEFFDIEVFTNSVGAISQSDLELLTRRLIESLVGELVYLDKIAAVKVIPPADTQRPDELTAFRHLGRHLAQLLQ